MKETEYLKIIQNTLHNTNYLGDDCAYLKDLDIYVTHDTLVQDVHFSLETTSAFDLGCKAAAVNLSDLAAACSKPLYITISLSLPVASSNAFVESFYKGIDKVCEKFGIAVIGGDLTGSEKIMISICAIGKNVSKHSVSRKFAKKGDYIITTGCHGDSAAGLKLFPKLTPFSNAHLRPEPRVEEGLILAKTADSDFAVMDSSDGLGDALYKLASASSVKISVDFDKIPVNKNLIKVFKNGYKDLVLWGGEDFELVASVNESVFSRLDKTRFFQIGRVTQEAEPGYVSVNDGEQTFCIDKNSFEQNSYKHFEE